MDQKSSKVSNVIMRRVYYAYALRLLLHTNTLHAAGAVALLVMLSSFVSFTAVWQNLAEVQVGSVGVYIYSALVNTEAWTLLGCAAFIALLISYVRSSRLQRAHPLQFA